MIDAAGLSHSYVSGVPVLRDIHLRVDDGQMLGLIGPNGSGKTTLLRALHGAIAPDAGSIAIDGAQLAGLNAAELAREVAVVVQEPRYDFPMTVADTVLLGRLPHLGVFQRYGHRDRAIAAQSLARVGIAHLAHRAVTTLSGGEHQRVLIARALAQNAGHLLMDEPTNHLDVHYQHEVLSLVRGLGMTTVVVLHDLNLAARYCDRIMLLDAGTVRAYGEPEEVLVPDILEPVYRLAVERVIGADGVSQILLSRESRTTSVRYP